MEILVRKLSLMIEMIVMRYREIIKFKYGYLLLWMYIVNGCKCMISMVVWGGGVGWVMGRGEEVVV